MPRAELMRMGIASVVAIVAMSFLALDAVVDVNATAIMKRIETARASIVDVAMAQPQLAFAVQAWSRHSQEGPVLEHCLAFE